MVDAPCFSLEITGVGHFERRGRPHAIWAQIGPSAALHMVRQRVERACAAVGLERETRRFTPHITLARLGPGTKAIGPWLAANGALRAGPWEVEAFSLFESHLAHTGAQYEEIIRYRLAQPRPEPR